ncbi:hypothetical protein D3H59_22005 [Micromonospora endophytica]|nr:hypothetical protein D3H59_22005 [Micromonospora endophytica]
MLDDGIDLSPDSPRLHDLAATIAACCHILPLKAYRLARGLKVQEAVDALHQARRDDGLPSCRLSREQLTHFENGPARPGDQYRDTLCRFYRTGPVQMGWATDYTAEPNNPPFTIRSAPGQTRPASACLDEPEGTAKEAAVQRREALRLILTTSGAVLPAPLLELLDQLRADMDTIIGSSTVSTIALDRWESAAEGYGYAFKTRPPRAVLEDVLLDFADLQAHAARRQPIDSQTRIYRITAQLAGTAANILTDLGHHRHAREWFATAALAADETSDRTLASWVRAREATVSLYHQRPPQIAITLAAEAQARAGNTPCAGAALAAATEARAWARLGHTQQALTALRHAEAISSRLSETQQANSIYGYPSQQLAFHREATLTIVGNLKDAEAAQREALALYPATEHINPTLIRLDQAACTIRTGDIAGGQQLALHHLSGTPQQYRTPLVLSRARELADLGATRHHIIDLRVQYLQAVDALAVAR